MLALAVDDGVHLFQMQLIRNGTIVACFQTTQKHAIFHGFFHCGIARIIFGSRSFEQSIDSFQEFVIAKLGCSQVIRRVAFGLRSVVFGRPLVEYASEKGFVRTGGILSDKALKKSEVFPVAIVLAHLARRKQFSLRAVQDAHQYERRIHRAHGIKQIDAAVGT